MSDFIYSKQAVEQGKLTTHMEEMYHEDIPTVQEFHGEWGSLAVSRNLYHGFQPYQTDDYLCVVVGGPVLYFRDNTFLTDEDAGAIGTQAIFNRWIDGSIKWDEDLSGPFVLFFINKRTKQVTCVTDLMSFIPVYAYQDTTNLMLSTHVDALAKAAGQQQEIDVVSKVDFILHGVVTFPYTVYKEVKQLTPATEHHSAEDTTTLQESPYWIPTEKTAYSSIKQAALELREGLYDYVDRVLAKDAPIAQFISGGEDSRALSALLSSKRGRDAFIFLDQMNREGRVAKQAAEAYHATFKLATRTEMHYLDILPDCAAMIGDGSQYFHAHTFGFHKSCKLNDYVAVFGGLFSDALLKGARIKKIRGSSRFPFVPQMKRKDYSPVRAASSPAFKAEIMAEVTKRREAHLDYVRTFRDQSAEEWFELWPSSMNMNIPNLHANRRLFRSYEPFMNKECVKIGASVPQSWKMNRRLFHKAVQPMLEPTKWLLHGDGKYPYLPWYINTFVQFGTWAYKEVGTKAGWIKGIQGPWMDWNQVIANPAWRQAVEDYADGTDAIASALEETDAIQLYEKQYFDKIQQLNFMQTLYENHKLKTDHDN